MVLRISCEFSGVTVKQAFDFFTAEIKETLSRKGIITQLESGGKLESGSSVVARITYWDRPNAIGIEWWQPETRGKEFVSTVKINFEPLDGDSGTRIVVENHGWENVLSGTRADPIDWFTDIVAGPLLAATTPGEYGEWLINRIARKPSGTSSKKHYSDPIYHKPNFESIFNHLSLTKEDYLLEIGCGGGYFLRDALKTGCRAAAIDHSPDMVEVAKDQNLRSIKEGRLNLFEADAESLPFEDEQFTCAVSTGVFHFIEHPSLFLSEAFRVLRKGGRFILFLGTKRIRGTPAEPDPITYRFLNYYEDDELMELAARAGFKDTSVLHPDQKEFAVNAGIPEEHLELFSNPSFGQLLIAYKR